MIFPLKIAFLLSVILPVAVPAEIQIKARLAEIGIGGYFRKAQVLRDFNPIIR